ncbi:MAG: FAD-dependent oxidoreductase [Fimbriiglobus sp.]|nr:FAD-dependent oxidoreductase [Fimbriiglobus sp.]
MSTPPSLVVFSHLRWDFVFQRPQHVLSRLARKRPVLFIEEPIPDPVGPPRWEVSTPSDGVTVCRPRTSSDSPGYSAPQLALLAPLVRQLVAEQVRGRYDLWFYTPMALPLADDLDPRVIVYDCMDELSLFRGAPPELLPRETELLKRADVVFTGGPSLFKAKQTRHANAHCFPSSVDGSHFGRAAGGGLIDLPDQASLPRPRLGYFGVIDERFDIDLLREASAARPNWQFVMVGPVVKIDPADLPRAANIHYLGGKKYHELPAYLSGWDVALLPFARNDATRFISPTKTLEYMAAGKPIVSTPITDVAEPYGDVVRLADTAEQFVAACGRALEESQNERAGRVARYSQILAATSWDLTTAAMEREIEKAASRSEQRTPPTGVPRKLGAVIIGAGPTGLSAAYHLGEDSLLLEANDTIGGWCRSVVDNGFTFDFAGHIMFSNEPYVHEMYERLLGDNVHWQDREAWVFSKRVYSRYPFQGSLYGLPPEVIKECVMGAIEARYGTASARPEVKPEAKMRPANGYTNGVGKPAINGVNRLTARTGDCVVGPAADGKDILDDCCGDGIAESTIPLSNGKELSSSPAPADAGPRNFEEFIYTVWGAGIAKHFAIPYNRKIWAVPLDQMETSWLGGRVPMPDLGEMIEGALSPKPKPMGPNARFGYPLRGGFQALMDGFRPFLQGELKLNARVTRVSAARHTVTLTDGTEYRYEQLVSTMPLPLLVRALGDEVPEAVRQAAAALRHTSVRCVNIGIGRENLTDKHWIYYPEETVFHRIFVQGNASPHCNPPGGFGLTCEITYGPLKPLPYDGDALIRRCIDDCIQVGLFTADDPILCANQIDMPHAYVVYDHARPKNVQLIREWLSRHDIHLAGRYSEWEYYNSDHAFLAGRKVADAVRDAQNRKIKIPARVIAAV